MSKAYNSLNLIILTLYLFIRFFMTSWLDSQGAYSSYFFEVITLILFFKINFHRIKGQPEIKLPFFFYSLIFFPLGIIICLLLKPLKIVLPIDISLPEIFVVLLFVAPILEELIFRFFIWKNLEFFKINKTVVILLTSMLFSYSHLHAIWFVDENYFTFIYYQTTYTLILGFLLGLIYKKTNSIVYPITAHFFFNFGFYLGFKYLI